MSNSLPTSEQMEHDPVKQVDQLVLNGARTISMNQELFDIYVASLQSAGRLDANGEYDHPTYGHAKVELDKGAHHLLVNWTGG